MKKLIAIFPILMILSLFSAYAELNCGFEGLSNNGYLTVMSVINVSFSSGAGGTTDDTFSLIINASSVTTQNSSSLTLFIVNQSNSTAASIVASRNKINVSVPTFSNLILQEGNDYVLTASVENSTDRVACNSTRTGITIDRVPTTAPTAITFSNPIDNAETITSTINRSNANRCFIRFGSPQAARTAMTLSGSTCTYTASFNNPPNSDYQTYFEADDRTNSTLSALQFVTISSVKSDGGGLFGGTAVLTNNQGGVQSALGGNTNPFAPKSNFQDWINNNPLIVVLLIGAGLYYFSNKK